MAKDKDKSTPPAGENPPEQTTGKQVQVICEGTHGPELLVKGDITDSPDYVALLETERGRKLVKEVQ